MDCFVCDKPAEYRETGGDYVPIHCEECGDYRVVGTLEREITKTRRLQTEGMQQWLREQRERGESSPLINSFNVIWR
jgi:hypothetical protein